MTIRCGHATAVLFAAALTFGPVSPAHASAFATSTLIANGLVITPAGGVVSPLPATYSSSALAQNSVGDLVSNTDEDAVESPSNAVVLWAVANGSAEEGSLYAQTSAFITGMTAGAANAAGQGQAAFDFLLSCPTEDCGPSAFVDVSINLTRTLIVSTDAAGVLAETQTTINMLLDGDSIAFETMLLSIGPSDAASVDDFLTLMGSALLNFGQTYSLLARADSESMVINGDIVSQVPEPGTLTLFGIGLLAAGRSLRRRYTTTDFL